jgi:TonB family protein
MLVRGCYRLVTEREKAVIDDFATAGGVRTRLARPEDAIGLATVHHLAITETFEQTVPAYVNDRSLEYCKGAWLDRLAANAVVTNVLLNGEEILGFASAGKTEDQDLDETIGEVDRIYLHPSVWGQGYGGQLMKWCEEELVRQGFRDASLWVFEVNSRARAFYQRLGYSFDGKTKTAYGTNLLRYRKALLVLLLLSMLAVARPALAADSGTAPDFAPYISNVQNIVGTQWRAERRRFASGGEMEMAFKVGSNGQISNVVVQKSSGNPQLDELAKKIISSSYLPALPNGSPDGVDVQLTLAFSPDLAVEEQQLKDKVAALKKTVPPTDISVLDAMSAYARVLQEEGKSAEAVAVLKEALSSTVESTVVRANLLNQLARIYGFEHKNVSALPLLEERFSIVRALPKASPDEVAAATEDIGVCLQNLRRQDVAAKMFNKALELRLANPNSKSLSSLIDKMDAAEGTAKGVSKERLHDIHQKLLTAIENSKASNTAKAVALRTTARHCLNHLDPDSCNLAILAVEAIEPSIAPDDSLETLRAQSLYLLKKTPEALPLLQDALSQREKRIGVQARDVREHRDTLAGCYIKLGQQGKAEQLYVNALEQAEEQGNKESITKGLRDLAQFYLSLKPVDYGHSEQTQLRLLELMQQLHGALAPDTVHTRDQLAAIYLAEGKKEEAVQLYRKLVSDTSTSDSDKYNALTQLAAILTGTGAVAEAETILKSLPQQPDPIAEKHRLYNLARVNGMMERRNEQESYLKELREFCNKQPSEQDHLLGQATLASYYWRHGNYESARPDIEQEYELSRRLEGPDRLISKVERERIERFYVAAEKYEQAEALLKADIEPSVRPNSTTISVNSILLSRLYEKQGKKEEAEDILAEAVTRLSPSERPIILCNLATLYSSHGKPKEAIKLLQREIPAQTSIQRRNALSFCLAKAFLVSGDRHNAILTANRVLTSLKNPIAESPELEERILFLPVTASADTEKQSNIPTSVMTGELVRTKKSKNGNGCFEVYFIDDEEYGIAPNRRIAKVVRKHFTEEEPASQLVFFPEGTEEGHTVEAAQELVTVLLKQCQKEH